MQIKILPNPIKLKLLKIFEEDETNIFEDEDEVKDKKEKENKIIEVFKLLKPVQSKLLELRFLKGYKIKEAAEELKISVSNAKVMQMRALNKVKKIYEGRDKTKKP
jgi:RNA polymerase sigma factor (sigma-70 family)